MKGIENNEMEIKYVQTQIQTVASSIQTTFTHMNDFLITQLKHSNHLNHELEEFKLGVIDLAEGKLSPLLIEPKTLKSAIMIYENCLKEITLVLILLLTIFNIFILQEIFSLHVTIATFM